MPPRRIAHIIGSLAPSGAAKQLTLLATRLPRDEFEVHVLALARGGQFESALGSDGIPVSVIHQRGWLDPAAGWQIRRWLKRLRPDLVHTWQFGASALGRAAALSAGIGPLVVSEHSPDPWKRWPHLAADRLLARRTARVVVSSASLRQRCIAQGIAAEKILIIPSGVPVRTRGPLSRDSLLAELGLPTDARLIASFNALRTEKRIKDVVWAADLLKVIRDDVHLLILGDGPERAALTRYRDLVEIGDRVHFLDHRDDPLSVVEHCDLAWVASAYEGLSDAVMESLSAGVPVVATDIPGVRELVTDGEQGFLVPVGDRAALARYANKLLDDPALRQRLGAAGRERMLREYSVDAMVARHAALYGELLG